MLFLFLLPVLRISIHAPREGGDEAHNVSWRTIYISIHAPREGGDKRTLLVDCDGQIFQSTPPARGATYSVSTWPRESVFQSTPPARGATVYR